MLVLHRGASQASRPLRPRDAVARARAVELPSASPTLICASGERLTSRQQIIALYREVVALLLETLARGAPLGGIDALDEGAAARLRAADDACVAAADAPPLAAHLARREAQRAQIVGGGRDALGRGAARHNTLDARDADGCTALIYVVRSGAPLVAQQLLRAGASATCADRCGNTPEHYAWAFCDERSRDLMLHVLRGDGERAEAAGSPRGRGGIVARTAVNDFGQAPDEVAGCRERLTAPLRALRRQE